MSDQTKPFLTFRLGDEMRQAVEQIADREERTLGNVVRRLIRAGLSIYQKDTHTT